MAHHIFLKKNTVRVSHRTKHSSTRNHHHKTLKIILCSWLSHLQTTQMFLLIFCATIVFSLTAFPDTPPYVVFPSFPTAGQALPLELRPIRPETVLMAVTPSAPPSLAALRGNENEEKVMIKRREMKLLRSYNTGFSEYETTIMHWH